jgi:hypothetical protein
LRERQGDLDNEAIKYKKAPLKGAFAVSHYTLPAVIFSAAAGYSG